MQKDDVLHPFNRIKEATKGFVCHPFVQDSKPPFIIKADLKKELEKIDFQTLGLVNSPNSGSLKSTNKTEFLQLVNNIQLAIKKGQIQKAIASKIEWVEEAVNPFEVFVSACQMYPNAFVYYWHHPKVGSWLGATPETFIRLKNGIANTMALAGTQPVESVNWSDKEIEEQALVNQHIIKVCTDLKLDFSQSKTETVKAGVIAHLRTEFAIKAEQIKLNPLLENLHPTPAVCGLPKKEALKLIKAFEKHERQYYCGFLGPVDGFETLDLFVNLRCMQVFTNGVVLYLGAGITAASIADNEWEETCLKSQTLKKAMEQSYASKS